MGSLYIRFYKNHVQVSLAAAAYEVVSPWSTGDVTDLRWAYIPDEKAVYFTHPNYAMRKLAWTSDASWALSETPILAVDKAVMVLPNGGIVYSEDSKNWVRDSTNLPRVSSPYTRNCLRKGNTNWITTSDAPSQNLHISEDAKNWTKVGPDSDIGFAGIVVNEFGMGIIFGSTSGTIYHTSDDGLSWAKGTAPNISNGLWSCGAYDPATDTWRVASTNASAYSTDGRLFTSIADTAGTQTMMGIGVGGGHWVAVGYEAGVTSGAIWIASAASAQWDVALQLSGDLLYWNKCNRGIAYAEPGGSPLWVTITYTNRWVYTSPNGAVWTRVATLADTTSYPYDMAVIKDRFYVVKVNAAATSMVLVSTVDGIDWRTETDWDVPYDSGKVRAFGISDRQDIESFDTANHYPKTITSHEGRLIIGPSKNEPSTLWGSKSNVIGNFYLGEFADEAWSYKISSDRNVDIQWIMGGMAGLVVGTRTGEGILVGSEAEGITPSTAQFRWQSTFGSDNIQPVRVHDHIIFSQRGGEIIRGYVPGAGAQAYQSPDLTQYADHIAEGGVHEFDHQDDPQTIVYAVRHDGTLLALTFETNAVAWSRIVTDGSFESVAVIPTAGAEDEVWAVVKRNIGAASSTVRYIEYFDTLKVASKNAAHFVDCGYENAACGSATVYANVMAQLAGESVDVLVNGNIVEHGKVVTVSGTLTITTPGATHIHAGLPCPAYAQTMRIETGSAWGAGMGLSKRNANLLAWVHDSIGGEFGPELSLTEAVAFNSASALTTDLLEVNFPGTWDRDGYIWCIQRDPLPMTVVAVAPDIEVGDK
jgi:hypothetical protein